jgi:hypothetical protein
MIKKLVISTIAVFLLGSNSQILANVSVTKTTRKEAYERFHDVLHPLQHEALPQRNFAEIRRQAKELVKRGKAIVSLGRNQASERNRVEFSKALKKFDQALTKFKSDAGSGSDENLAKSFEAVHDLYEELDALG